MGELIVNGIKWAFIIGISVVFMTALTINSPIKHDSFLYH